MTEHEEERELWEKVSEAVSESDCQSPLHTLLVLRVHQRMLERGYAEDNNLNYEALKSALDTAVANLPDESPSSPHIAVAAADALKDQIE